MMPEVILSDGEPLVARTVGIFELDVIERQFIGPFTYPIELLGGVVRYAEWDLDKYEEKGRDLPSLPKTPKHLIEEETEEWYQLRDYERLQAALYHRIQRLETAAQYYEDVLLYIFDNCMDRDDLRRIVTEDDWEKVYKVILVPQITMALIVSTLKNTFAAKFANEEIFEALDSATGGHGSYNALRKWENVWATQMGISDLELAVYPVEERARRVCAMMLDTWMEFLEVDRIRKRTVKPDAPSK
jgi:hypothetical protein